MGFDALSPWHLLILAAVFVVLFGSRKLPDAARSLGKSMRIFKAETRALRDGDEPDAPAVQQAPVVQQPAPPQPAPPQYTPAAPDGTIVSGQPLGQPQQNQPSA